MVDATKDEDSSEKAKRRRREKKNVHTNRTLSIKIDRLLQLNERYGIEQKKEREREKKTKPSDIMQKEKKTSMSFFSSSVEV